MGRELMIALDFIANLEIKDFDYYDFCTIVLKMSDSDTLEFLDMYGSENEVE